MFFSINVLANTEDEGEPVNHYIMRMGGHAWVEQKEVVFPLLRLFQVTFGFVIVLLKN